MMVTIIVTISVSIIIATVLQFEILLTKKEMVPIWRVIEKKTCKLIATYFKINLKPFHKCGQYPLFDVPAKGAWCDSL